MESTRREMSLWYDKFLEGGPLHGITDHFENPAIKIREQVINSAWDVNRLNELLGNQCATTVMETMGMLKDKKYVLIWILDKKCVFSTKSAWELIR